MNRGGNSHAYSGFDNCCSGPGLVRRGNPSANIRPGFSLLHVPGDLGGRGLLRLQLLYDGPMPGVGFRTDCTVRPQSLLRRWDEIETKRSALSLSQINIARTRYDIDTVRHYPEPQAEELRKITVEQGLTKNPDLPSLLMAVRPRPSGRQWVDLAPAPERPVMTWLCHRPDDSLYQSADAPECWASPSPSFDRCYPGVGPEPASFLVVLHGPAFAAPTG